MDTDKHHDYKFLLLEETVAKPLSGEHLIGFDDNLDMKRMLSYKISKFLTLEIEDDRMPQTECRKQRFMPEKGILMI